jgi:hypothetical protein
MVLRKVKLRHDPRPTGSNHFLEHGDLRSNVIPKPSAEDGDNPMSKSATARILKNWNNEAVEIVLRKSGTPARYEVEIAPIDRSGPFALTRNYPARDLTTAEKIYRVAIEHPADDPMLRVVGVRRMPGKSATSRKRVTKKRR